MKNSRNILITGSAGFIGAALAIKLLNRGENVIGIDNINSYYDISLKNNRLKKISASIEKDNHKNWIFFKEDLKNKAAIKDIFKRYKPGD